MLNGTFSDVPAASNDPLFPLHHAFVDYILEMWIQHNHGEFCPPPGDNSAAKGHNYDDVIVPYLPLVRSHEMIVESSKLGWIYESLEGLEMSFYSCELYTFDNDSTILYPDSSTTQSPTMLPEFIQGQSTVSLKPLKSLQDTEASSDSLMKHKVSSITSQPQLLNTQVRYKVPYQRQQSMTSYEVCVFTSEELVFQIPPNCDELVFQNNLILPKELIPFSWISCFPRQTYSTTSDTLNANYDAQVYSCIRVA